MTALFFLLSLEYVGLQNDPTEVVNLGISKVFCGLCKKLELGGRAMDMHAMPA